MIWITNLYDLENTVEEDLVAEDGRGGKLHTRR
jgi:hypothetical protein